MGIVATTELSTITASRKFGEPPVATRSYVVEVNDPATSQTDIAYAPGISFLDPHPEAYYLLAFDAKVSNYNGSRYHYLVEWSYEVPKQANPDPNPLARPDIWKWSTGGLAVPALTFYDVGDVVKPLVNAADDVFEGLMQDIATLQASISGNRATFDVALAQSVQNTLNDAVYLGGAKHTWKCEGISGQQQVEIVNDSEVRFYSVEVTLAYRPDGWPLLIPDVGWNFIDPADNKKKRVFVIDPENNNEKIPATAPQALNAANGNLLWAGVAGAPAILTRRVNREANFNQYFGNPT